MELYIALYFNANLITWVQYIIPLCTELTECGLNGETFTEVDFLLTFVSCQKGY